MSYVKTPERNALDKHLVFVSESKVSGAFHTSRPFLLTRHCNSGTVALRSEVDTWLRFMADTVNSYSHLVFIRPSIIRSSRTSGPKVVSSDHGLTIQSWFVTPASRQSGHLSMGTVVAG
jgi:hypothetical protein